MRCSGRSSPARFAPPGLHPSLGIHHHNRYNAFCLADDLMEPFRPAVDRAVAEYMSTHESRLQTGGGGQAAHHRRTDRPLSSGRPAADALRCGCGHGRFAGRRVPGQRGRNWNCPIGDAMPRRELVLSGYRGMWLFAMFDLPVTTPKARKRYTAFRKLLVEQASRCYNTPSTRGIAQARRRPRRTAGAFARASPGRICPPAGCHGPAVRKNGELHWRTQQNHSKNLPPNLSFSSARGC